MLKTMSFLDAHKLLCDCERAVEALKPILGETMLEMIQDAVNCYAQTPYLWGCEEEADYAALFALALTQAGFNTMKPECDVTRHLMPALSSSLSDG